MSVRKVVAVVGATGNQGNGLARAILADPGGGYGVRAVTRDPSSAGARELARLGAEVVAADLADPGSLDAAFAGAYGAYCVTFQQPDSAPDRETLHATSMAEAAKRNGLAHVVWSTFEDTREFVPLADPRLPTLFGKYKVPHYDAKGEADAAFRRLGVPTTFLRTAFYWENLVVNGMGPKREPDGSLVFSLPLGTARMPGIAVEDIGRCAYTIFRSPHLTGETISLTGENLTGTEMAADLGEALGEPVIYRAVPPEVIRGLGFPGAEAIGNMFQFFQEFEDAYVGARDRRRVLELNPRQRRFRDWLALHAPKTLT